MRFVVSIVSVLALTACGTSNQSKKSSQQITESNAIAESANLPAVTLIKVPVDASGKELHEKAEMRLANSSDMSDDSVEAVFGASSAPQTFVDELDQTSSTESFHGWRHHCRFACGHRAYSSYSTYNYSSYDWSFYRPTYYYYGYYYNWNYAQTYRCRGYNYYRYNSSFSQSYSGYGQAPGYGYAY